MEDFTEKQVAELNERYGRPLRSPEEIGRFYRLVHGQPYLVRRGMNEMVQQPLTLDRLEKDADRDQGIFGDHLRRLFIALSRDPGLTSAMKTFVDTGQIPDDPSFQRLRASGLLVGDTFDTAKPRCRLYISYLKHHLK